MKIISVLKLKDKIKIIMAAGEAKSDFWWLVGVICLLGLAWLFTGGPARWETGFGPFINPPVPLDPKQVTYYAPDGTAGSEYRAYNQAQDNSGISMNDRSIYYGLFSIEQGNARHEYQPNQEYITLNYTGNRPVNITGWRLSNGAGERNYDIGGDKLIRGVSSSVFIPQVAKLPVSGQGKQFLSDMVLAPSSSRVVINTGNLPSSSDFPSSYSFQVNSCSGYLGKNPRYGISPSIGGFCPSTTDWPGIQQMSNDCYNFIGTIGSCRTPEFERRADGMNYIDNREDRLSSVCRNFIKENLNYNGCITAFSNRPDFYKQEWRVFLNHPGELWSKDREVITLYDNFGKIVAQLKY